MDKAREVFELILKQWVSQRMMLDKKYGLHRRILFFSLSSFLDGVGDGMCCAMEYFVKAGVLTYNELEQLQREALRAVQGEWADTFIFQTHVKD